MKRITDEEAVLKYHLKGLTAKEIAKLLDLSERSVQRLKRAAQLRVYTKTDKRAEIAATLYRSGYTYKEIGERLNVSRQSVYNYLRRVGAIHKKAYL